ncbi:hypothetical protein BH20ACI3_BH20ACI3_40260 [soil metagenome]
MRLAVHTFHRSCPAFEIEVAVDQIISSGDDTLQGVCRSSEVFRCWLVGAFPEKAIDSLSPPVNTGFGIDANQDPKIG